MGEFPVTQEIWATKFSFGLRFALLFFLLRPFISRERYVLVKPNQPHPAINNPEVARKSAVPGTPSRQQT